MPITCPNNSFVTDTPRFYDRGGNEFFLPESAKITWSPGDEALASLVVAADTRSARIVPLHTTVGDYNYSYTYTDPDGGPVVVSEVVTFANPFAATAKSNQVISSQAIGG